MRQPLLIVLLSFPVFCFGQNEVGPDTYFPYLVMTLIAGISVAAWLVSKGKPRIKIDIAGWFANRRVEARLMANKKNQPEKLILVVKNNRSKAVGLEAPVLTFRKLWSVRKFRLKGMNREEIYPLNLESGKSHELQFKLDVFHKHDPALRSYYWARVWVKDTTGKTHGTNFITLHKRITSK